MLNFGASKPRVRGGPRLPGPPPGSAPADKRKGTQGVVSSHQYLPAWNRTEQNLKFLAVIDMKL